jgi:hypothetical protein
MKNIFVNGKWEALDGEYELTLAQAYRYIKGWKSWYFKKNSAKPATIRLLISTKGPKDYWKNWIQLFRDGKMVERFRIRDEASDTLSRDLPEENVDGNYIYIIDKFEPVKKVTNEGNII